MKIVLLLILLVIPALPQTISAGAVYQAAVASGIQYISPSSGNAILNEKVGLNWKNLTLQLVGNGSIAAVSAGLGGVISIGKPVLEGLAVGHLVFDNVIQPILALGAPNPASLPALLELTGAMTVTPTSCAENSMYASGFRGVALPAKRGQGLPSPATVTINGVVVTYVPQGSTVLRNAAGSKIKQFTIVDVLACPATVMTIQK